MKNKRQFLAVLLCLLLTGVTTACSTAPRHAGEESSAHQQEPVVEYSTPDFTQVAGFAVGTPTGFLVQRCALINGEIGELLLLPEGPGGEGKTSTLRIAVDDDRDISGIYMSSSTVRPKNIKGTSVEIRETPGGTAVASWLKNGYRYSLYRESDSSQSLDQLLEGLVSQLSLSPEWAPGPIPPAQFWEEAEKLGLSAAQVHALGSVGLGFEKILNLSRDDLDYFLAPGTLPYGGFVPTQLQEMALAEAGLSADQSSILYNLGYSYPQMLALSHREKDYIFPTTSLVERLCTAGCPRAQENPRACALAPGETYRDLIERALSAQDPAPPALRGETRS